MKKAIASAVILTAVLCISGNLWAYSGDGDGSAGNPYQIANVADFQQLTIDDPNWNMSFILTADINLAGVTLTPVGNSSTEFTGVFDGNDNIISNAVINQPGSDYVGLFGYVGIGGQIRNLGVEDHNITGRDRVGGLVGMNDSGTITGCYATGSVTGTIYVGGLVGYNEGGLTSCYATGSVTGDGLVGGLVGYNYYGTLTACYATGSVSGFDYVGGLVGYNYYGTLTACYATGSVTGTVSGERIGGLVGWNNDGTLTACYATGSVTGNSSVGGLVGYNYDGTLTACYATGSVTGTDFVGGLVGYNYYGTLTACYATGSVTGTDDVGGLVGWNHVDSTITDCFWDTQTCLPATVGVGEGPSTGVTGKTTAEMKTLSTFTDAGWDFASVWAMPLGQYYPVLFLRQMGDLNSDARVDMFDFAIFAENWLEGI